MVCLQGVKLVGTGGQREEKKNKTFGTVPYAFSVVTVYEKNI